MLLRLFIRLLAIAWVALCSLAAQATSSPLPVPTVEYSADRTVVSDAGTFTGKVYFARDKERSELSAGGMVSITILRRDLQLGYSLMPAQNMYRQLDFASARRQSGGATADDVDVSVVGNESIDGHATTKYKLLMKDGSAGGFMWFTQEGIAIKMDLLQKEHGKKTRMTMTLANLQVGTVDPQLFEVPAGYTQMPGGNPFSGYNGAATPSSGNLVSNPLSKVSLFQRH